MELTLTDVMILIFILIQVAVLIGLVGYGMTRPTGRRITAYLSRKAREEPVVVANTAAFVTNLLVLTGVIPVEMSERTELEIVAGVTFVANLVAREMVKPTNKEEGSDGVYR